jgi:hypothetical protein
MLGGVNERYHMLRIIPAHKKQQPLPPCRGETPAPLVRSDVHGEMISDLGRAIGEGNTREARASLRAAIAAVADNRPRRGGTLRRKAVLVATSYESGTVQHLPNCHRDAEHMRMALIERRGYHNGDIVVIQNHSASRTRITSELQALVAQSYMCDEIVFYYAGHGVQRRSYSDSEPDGLDECILTHELGIIRDKEIAPVIARCAPTCSMVFIADCCTSGSLTDATELRAPQRNWKRGEPPCHHVTVAASGDGTEAAQDSRGRGYLTRMLVSQMGRGDGCVKMSALCNRRIGSQRTVVSHSSDATRKHLFL